MYSLSVDRPKKVVVILVDFLRIKFSFSYLGLKFITFKKDAPFLMLKKLTPEEKERNITFTGNDRFEGYVVDLCEMLSKLMNFTYELSLVKDNKFGAKGIHF